MKIARNLNLIIPVQTEKGKAWIHATPINKEVFKEHFFILSKTFSVIFSEGLGVIAGPRIAYLMLERIAGDMSIWDGEKGVRNTLVNEIIRLANLVYPVEGKGYDTIPLDMALERKIVDLDEVAGQLVFFTCISSLNTPEQTEEMMLTVSGMWNSVASSLSLTDWIASLPTSKPIASTGETVSTSSAKSSTLHPEPDLATSGQIPV
ncbi:hypothetical protein AH775_06925 [Salmonella enterica subsp. enterica serovar Give]|uniref:hypothetical protein n=1 Tax=Salmonella enterica TaxID=28901 RepID=UPI00071AB662|nr:hypothetical protein [Salmonella enterica]ECI2789572.1 hypothetical protein [Salmonella enterica subsp. enterica serovar Give]EDS4118550.1 hypothetical protein [Salmonella enterica subsp. enterica serovar Braenderup]EGZ3889427.1 hypothetical protein [Salmonella enterica subsp. enterica serovar Bonn]EHH3969259.1 hypothetical protein [Salmonella enterica subsp. enterica serovar Hadar]AXD05079.1 hypothetical protein LFZ28_13845 [Salmonella enterica subsp. enterica serovar Milwaukee str. SA1995